MAEREAGKGRESDGMGEAPVIRSPFGFGQGLTDGYRSAVRNVIRSDLGIELPGINPQMSGLRNCAKTPLQFPA